MSANGLPVLNGEPELAGFYSELEGSVRGEVRFDRLSRALYSTDASVYQIVPAAIVLPETERDVVATVQTCECYGVPLTARGGGTSQAGQSIGAGVILDTSKYLNRILEIDAEKRRVRVQPGCVLDDLNAQLRPLGLQFAPDISTSNRATIGGMVANNSSGARSVIYGKTIDHVHELKVVLSDGTVIQCAPLDGSQLEAKCAQDDLEGECYRTVRRLASEQAKEIERRFPKILRRVGGYNLDAFRGEAFNLAHLFVGSEGTLGVVVEATLKLVELPRARATLVIEFDDLLDALAITPTILTHRPAAVEVVDRYVLDSTKLNPEASRLRAFLRSDPGAILLVELYGEGPGDLNPRLDALEADLRSRGLGDRLLRATEAAEQARIWKLRTLALGLSMAEKGDAKAISFVEDTAVAPERLRDYIEKFLRIIARHGTKAGVYAHASVGCLHVRPVINLKTKEGVRRFQAIAAEVAALVLEYGGALSGEHGDGLVRSPFQEKMYGPQLYAAFRKLKRTFDPRGVLNPGKIVNAPPLTTNLRFGAAYVTPDVPTLFDFSIDGGFTRSVELCAGVGECRKTRTGTMCPSYQATRDECDSTRGRANVLRLAITGQAGLQGLTDPAVREVLDLCLECKACKAECPTNVDMARLKAETLYQIHRETGVPWRNRLFGHVAEVGRWGSRLSPVSNWVLRSGLGRRIAEKLLGIDRRRLPPRFAGRTLVSRLGRLLAETPPRDSPPGILLLPDTFANYYEPDVGEAAATLFERAGRRVALGPRKFACCGRPLISNGLLDRAAALAAQNVESLWPWVEQGWKVVACEPSCLLTLKDDYPALVRDEAQRRALTIANACQTFEEALDSVIGSESGTPERLQFGDGPKRILVQGHCHQRSLVGMGPTLRLLRRIPNADVVDLDAGCCGMAGSFGYESEHYDVSRLVGEHRLFPALRSGDPDAVVVAPGFSCRLQIDHFTGRFATHPAPLLCRLIGQAPATTEAGNR